MGDTKRRCWRAAVWTGMGAAATVATSASSAAWCTVTPHVDAVPYFVAWWSAVVAAPLVALVAACGFAASCGVWVRADLPLSSLTRAALTLWLVRVVPPAGILLLAVVGEEWSTYTTGKPAGILFVVLAGVCGPIVANLTLDTAVVLLGAAGALTWTRRSVFARLASLGVAAMGAIPFLVDLALAFGAWRWWAGTRGGSYLFGGPC